MLQRLLIRNYALIGEEEINLSEGFTVLTGETGAGKTLLTGALGLVLGKRADHSMLFDDSQKCIVEAEFTGIPVRIAKMLKTMGEFDMESDSLIVRREMTPGGTSRAFINDTPVQLNTLREAAQLLIDLHGQHENQLLLSPEQQLRMLDLYAGTTGDAEAFSQVLTEYKNLARMVAELQARESEARRQMDYFQFQLAELNAARLDADEEADLEKEVALLENAGAIREQLAAGTDALYDGEDNIYSRIAQVLQRLDKISNWSEQIKEQSARLREIASQLKDVTFELQDLADSVSTDPGRLEELLEKQNAWNKLKMKFAVRTVGELIALRDEFEARVNDFSSIESQIAEAEKKRHSLERKLAADGIALEARRQKAAPGLAKKVVSLLKEVGLEAADFSIGIERQAAEGKDALKVDDQNIRVFSHGINKVEFRIRTNAGTPLGPLSQVASGGEISRVMLALKAALAGKADLGVMVFDEIDTGISGEVANKVARVMDALSANVQVIAITHLPQIAGKGSAHLNVVKVAGARGGKPQTVVRVLGRSERIQEIAKMLSGDPPGKSAIKNAEELLKN